ncbi:MAG TPA: hypothetical protein VGP82_17945 [Ktedonobacterales bacterium]|nr:hypothetical protein [Ktedonobacterales bacterium]
MLLVALFGALLANRLPGRAVHPAATTAVPTATVAPGQTPIPTTTQSANGVPQGWLATQAGTGNSLDIAFAPSTPALGYAVAVEPGGSVRITTKQHTTVVPAGTGIPLRPLGKTDAR